MATISFDLSKKGGKIKPMNAVNNGPTDAGVRKVATNFDAYAAACFPYARNHDASFFHGYGGEHVVDVHRIFKDFSADENDPSSYIFEPTDEYLCNIMKAGTKVFYRLGASIEHRYKYGTRVPTDMAKWARVCEHIIRHYNEGWADGFHFGIDYWEIWNEPECRNGDGSNPCWQGTDEQFVDFYAVVSKHLKACFGDSIKVGGYGASSMYGILFEPKRYGLDIVPQAPDDRYEKGIYRADFFIDFVKYIKQHSSPIDFFSWHCYGNVEETLIMDSFIHRVLCEYGYGDLERHLNEWNNAPKSLLHGSSYASAAAAAMLCAMQSSHTYMLCYYDARITASTYGGFFAPLTYKPVSTYYSFAAFGELYALGEQAVCKSSHSDVYAIAATDKERKAVMITNFSEEVRQIQLNVNSDWTVYLIDKDHFISKTDLRADEFTLDANQVVIIKNY